MVVLVVLALGDEGHLSGCLLKGLKWTEESEEPVCCPPISGAHFPQVTAMNSTLQHPSRSCLYTHITRLCASALTLETSGLTPRPSRPLHLPLAGLMELRVQSHREIHLGLLNNYKVLHCLHWASGV